MAAVGGRPGGSRPRFRWTEPHRIAQSRRSTIRFEERQAAAQLYSRRCDEFYRRVVGRFAVAEEKNVVQDMALKPQVSGHWACDGGLVGADGLDRADAGTLSVQDPDLTAVTGDLVGADGLVLAHNSIQLQLVNEPMMPADAQESSIHLGQVNSFAKVPRLILQEVLRSNSLTKRTRAEKLSQDELIISAKRTNMDEDILTKAQRLAAKRNLETSYFQGYSLVQILETFTEGGNPSTNTRCLPSFGGGGDGSLCESWMAIKCKE